LLTNPSAESRRLAVLIISNSEDSANSSVITIGKSEPASSDLAERDSVCELLSASNIQFDIISVKEITEHTLAGDDLINYVAVIITVPFSQFSDESVRLISAASQKLGISLVSSFDHADDRSKKMFGIESLGKKRLLKPLRIKIASWPGATGQKGMMINYGFLSGVPGIRSRGLNKLSWKLTWKKLTRLLRSMILPYFIAELMPEVTVIATDLKGNPVVWSYKYGIGINYYFSMQGTLILDKFNEMHRLVRSIIETNSGLGMASISLENTVALRLDDPGACCADYLNKGGVLSEEDWMALANLLEKTGIPLSVVYTPGWVDDGDRKGGRLFVDGLEIIKREPGALYDSCRVRYLRRGDHPCAYDHSAEYEGLRALAKKGLVEVHSHGLTHLAPDHRTWSSAKDRNKNAQWYHEFYHVKDRKVIEKEAQTNALSVSRDLILKDFGSLPLAFTPSGHRHGPDTDLLSFNAGYLLYSADYTGFYKKNLIIRNWKIRSVFLYLKNPSLFAVRSGYPFVGVVHDYEIKNGLDKFEKLIEKWTSGGVRKYLSMSTLIASLCSSMDARIDIGKSTLDLNIYMPTRPGDNKTFRELMGKEIPLKITWPDKMMPLDDKVNVSGGALLSSNQGSVNAITTLLIESAETPIIKVSLPFIKIQ
jgi:hypothetical protein